jgi:futalosine hydrolase
MGRRILVVTAVDAERDAITAGRPAEELRLPGTRGAVRAAAGGHVLDVVPAGVGPAAAGAGTAAALAAPAGYDLVVSAGIGGGFAPVAGLGDVVVATRVVAADLGADTGEGFVPVTDLGFGLGVFEAPPALVAAVADAVPAAGVRTVTGPVLTVSTVTGTAARARELTERHPGAAAEAMEGFGVATAAAAFDVPMIEIRAVSNAVGPRDRAAWRIGDALRALTAATGALLEVVA